MEYMKIKRAVSTLIAAYMLITGLGLVIIAAFTKGFLTLILGIIAAIVLFLYAVWIHEPLE